MKKSLLKLLTLLCLGLSLVGCNKNPDIAAHMLDGDLVFDPSINNPEEFLASAKYPNPSSGELDRHVMIAVHGFTASTFEWNEFYEWSADSTYRLSLVLLGGHGTTYDDFKASTWSDWAESIKLEYEALEALGYRKISLVGSSTGATLLLELVRSGYFDSHVNPENIFLIDPIVVASSKLQSIAGILGPMFVYVGSDNSIEKDEFYYHFKPHETISELNDLMKSVRNGLEDGFMLPSDTYLKIFHSKYDPTANSLSSAMIHAGLTKSDGSDIDVQIMDSDIHVFTRLAIRESVSTVHVENQEDAFQQMADRLK